MCHMRDVGFVQNKVKLRVFKDTHGVVKPYGVISAYVFKPSLNKGFEHTVW